ncbi:diacylglycerol/lipid kinase family protein [Streptomyces sp. MI02-7b]|uniref:diacylglycerol/lipid kinase family protein n=1 Tax=Streptomyces sp. MI02-7b TaxID=462941 RepID=UPI0029B7934A|nr:diacylglycerol kinase family protein [Streptomyces sp. MI02-7b]MDX3077599.1 diacylglycerol kinase family protein [Streptomyces sp. MI02-7b]
MERPASPARGTPRGLARLALATGAAALALPVVLAGLKSLLLVAVGLGGTGVTAAGVWWVLTRRGPVRVLAVALTVAAPVAVLLYYAHANLFWVALTSIALWVLALTCGRAAMRGAGQADRRVRERPAPPPRRPFLIMNPRSGGGKVGHFGLKEKAEALGARVALLDPDAPQDVAALARAAADEGADLLGVAGGDGTQALVAAVAAERGLPFLVISAGTRNHFAMDLGLDREDPAACLDALTDGVELRVDLGFVDGRPFVNNVSFGAYAAVVQSPAYRDDKVGTILELLPDLLTRRSGSRLTARAGATVLHEPQAVLVSNNPYRTGDPAGLGRRDRLDTGMLGVLGVTVDNAAQAAALLMGPQAPGLTVLTTRHIVVTADTPRIEAGVDGEALVLPVPVRCEIRPGALRVRLPRDRPGVPVTGARLDWAHLCTLALTTGRIPT